MGLAGLTRSSLGGGVWWRIPTGNVAKKKNPLKAAMSRQQQQQPLKASLTPSGGHQGALAGTPSLNTVAGRPGTPPTLPSPPQGANADPLVPPDEHFTAITRGPSSPSLQAFFNRPRSLFYLFIYLFFSFLPSRSLCACPSLLFVHYARLSAPVATFICGGAALRCQPVAAIRRASLRFVSCQLINGNEWKELLLYLCVLMTLFMPTRGTAPVPPPRHHHRGH